MVQVTFSQANDIYMMVKCKSPCLAGQYAVLGNAREIKECKNCPVDTFSEKEDETMEFPGKPHQACIIYHDHYYYFLYIFMYVVLLLLLLL